MSTRRFVEMVFEAVGTPVQLLAIPGWALSLLSLLNPTLRAVREVAYQFQHLKPWKSPSGRGDHIRQFQRDLDPPPIDNLHRSL